MNSDNLHSQVVLVTGINGFIASRIGLDLLKKGYHVRGTVRHSKSAQWLLDGAYKQFITQVETLEVPDFVVEGCFEQAVKGVHAIIHTASPMNHSSTNAQDYLLPAREGTLNILRVASQSAGPQLSIVVFTSSVLTMFDPSKGPDAVITEANSGGYFESEAERLGGEAPARILYAASKGAGEREIWKYRHDHKPPYAICTIHPGAVIGPVVQLPSSPALLTETLKPIWSLFSGESQELPRVFGNGAYCDVRDVAALHIWCMEHAADVSDQRFIANAGQGTAQAIADVLHVSYPERRDLMASGTPGEGYDPDYAYLRGGIDGSKACKWTGMRYIKFDQAIRDTARQMEAWLAL